MAPGVSQLSEHGRQGARERPVSGQARARRYRGQRRAGAAERPNHSRRSRRSVAGRQCSISPTARSTRGWCLSGPAQSGGTRPDIYIALNGPLAAPSRSVDVSALTGWLTLRAIEESGEKNKDDRSAAATCPRRRRKRNKRRHCRRLLISGYCRRRRRRRGRRPQSTRIIDGAARTPSKSRLLSRGRRSSPICAR